MEKSYNSVHKGKSSEKLLSSNRRENLISNKYFATHLGQFHGLWEQEQENWSKQANQPVDVRPAPVATIIYGMAMVRKMKNSGLTFTEFADQLLKFAVSSNSHSPRIDIVFDVYCKSSIKNAERNHRETGKLKFKKIIECQLIKQWGSFLFSGENKK